MSSLSRFIKSMEESIFIRLPIVVITVVLTIAIFNESIISFGYIVIVMLLMTDLVRLSANNENSESFRKKLRWVLVPYLLLDVLSQLMIQVPNTALYHSEWLDNVFGLKVAWQLEPSKISLGDDTKIIYTQSGNLGSLMIKGFLFFIISAQLQVLSSFEFKSYMLKWQQWQSEVTQKLGTGISYRFNNFKNKQVLQVAEENDRIDRMLWQVKRLIRKRDQLYKVQETTKTNESQFIRQQTSHGRRQTLVSNSRMSQQVSRQKSRDSLKRSHLQSHDLFTSQEQDQNLSQIYNQKDNSLEETSFISDNAAEEQAKRLQNEIQKEKDKIKTSYEKKMKKLPCCQKLYLWLRRNFTNDIIFRRSPAHLDDMVEQLQAGRTSIRSKLEISLHNSAKKELQQAKEDEVHEEDKVQLKLSRKRTKKSQSMIPRLDKSVKPQATEPLPVIIEESKNPSESLASKQNNLAENLNQLQSRESLDEENRIEALLSVLDKDDGNANSSNRFHSSDQGPKRLNEQILESDVYKQSQKPWDQARDEKTLLSWKHTFGQYLKLLIKVVFTYSEIPCYFWMIFSLLENPGLAYMVYAFLLFGYVLVEEQTPGRLFWSMIIVYTQVLIVVTFALNLGLWEDALSDDQYLKLNNWLDRNILGFKRYRESSFLDGLAFYYPQILLLLSIFVHIQKEIRLGIFDVPLEAYETFEEGLMRYRLYCVCKSQQERLILEQEFQSCRAIKLELNEEQILPYDTGIDSLSEFAKFDRSEQLGDPIYRREDLLQKELDFNNLFQQRLDLSNADSDDEIDQTLAVIQESEEPEHIELKHYSKSEDNYFTKHDNNDMIQKTWYQTVFGIFYDTSFFNRLFPLITQQKPGKDLYVFIATIQIVIITYTFLFYNLMVTTVNDNLSEQLKTNTLSGEMVVFVLLTLAIMVFDRIIYSTHQFQMHQKMTALDSDIVNAEAGDAKTAKNMLNISRDNYDLNHSAQFGRLADGALTSQSSRKATLVPETLEQRLEREALGEISDESWSIYSEDSENMEQNFNAYKESLVPKKVKASAIRVIRFYYLWLILIVIHYVCFYRLPQTVRECIETPQVKNNQIIKYGDLGYVCNQFGENGFIQFYYLLWCVYFALSSYQIKVGLPEIRRGSFLVDSFNVVSSTIYKGYLAIPFIFELRSIIDWTFTKTALDVFQWIKLAQVQADLYLAKCSNKTYMNHKLGKSQPFWKKILIGFSLTVFVLALIIGPIIIFSTLNPIHGSETISGGQLAVEIEVIQNYVKDNQNVNTQRFTLFQTEHTTQLNTLNSTQFKDAGFAEQTESTSKFSSDQVFSLQFSNSSSYQWQISFPDLQTLNQTLQSIQNGTESDTQVNSVLRYGFERSDSIYGTASNEQTYPISNSNQTNQTVVQDLIKQINCKEPKSSTLLVSDTNILQKTGSSSISTDIYTSDLAYTNIGYKLEFNCQLVKDEDGKDQPGVFQFAYWQMIPWFEDQKDEQIVYMRDNIFTGGGFGFFVFASSTLPNIFADYGSSIVVFYISVVFVIAALFRSTFVPKSDEIFITDAPYTEDILKICQSIHIYRVNRQLEKEEELYQILIDIMRSPEMIKSICGSSLKKKLQ